MLGLITDIFNQKRAGGTEPDGGQVVDHDRPDAAGREEDLVERLVARLREGDVSDEQRSVLRDHLVADVPNRVGVRIDHLQSKVGQLEAYTEAIEEFVDEEGTAQEVMEEVRASLERTEDRIDGLDARIESVELEGATARSDISGIREQLSDVDAHVQDVEGRHAREIAGVDARVGGVEDRLDESVAELSTDVEAIERDLSKITALEEMLESVESDVAALEDLQDRVVDLESRSEEVSGAVASNEERIEDLEALPETIQSMSDRIESLAALSDDVGQLREELEELGSLRDEVEQLRAIEDRVDSLEELRGELGDVGEDVEDLLTFRRRLIDSVRSPATTSTGD